jgi:hypothetical protein
MRAIRAARSTLLALLLIGRAAAQTLSCTSTGAATGSADFRILRASHSLNTQVEDVVLAAPSTCAALASASSPHPCVAATLSITDGGVTFAYVATAAG